MISVICCSHQAQRTTWARHHYGQLLSPEPHEFIHIPDARSLAEGYQRGVAQARGDILIFSHDDIEFLRPDTWLSRLKGHLSRADLVGLAGTNRLVGPAWAAAGPPHTFGQVAELDGKNEPFRVLICGIPAPLVTGMQAVDGLFMAVRRPVLESVRFDPETFDGFHGYDIDFSYRVFQAGYQVAVATDLPVLHASQGHFDDAWQRYAERFMAKHGPTLSQMRRRPFQHALVGAATHAELLEILEPQS